MTHPHVQDDRLCEGGFDASLVSKLARCAKSKESSATGDSEAEVHGHAWAKLLYLRDYGNTEVGGFGIWDMPKHWGNHRLEAG